MKVAKAFHSLGNMYTQMSMLPEALAMFERNLQITAHNHPLDELRLADAKHNVGQALCRLGRHSEGLALLDEALDIRIAALGPQHAAVADALVCIGGHAEALERYQRAHSTRKGALGPDQATVALSLRKPAHALACPGQTDPAIDECGKARPAVLSRNRTCEMDPSAFATHDDGETQVRPPVSYSCPPPPHHLFRSRVT